MNTNLSMLLNDKKCHIEHISPQNTVHECALKLNQLRIGALLVLENDQLKGIVTERDILWKLVARGDDSKKIRVADIMTTDLITVKTTTTVAEAMRIITDKRFRHLPVLNEEKKLIGIISIGDLTRWAMLSLEAEITALRKYIQGER